MNHRHPIRAAIWILVNHRSSFFSALPHSAAALGSQGPHLFSSKLRTPSPCTYPVCAWHPLQATQGSRESIDDNSGNDNTTKTMIVRVRCNIGTVKLRIGDEERATEATIRSTLLEKLGDKTSSPYKLTQDLSFDPAGARKIHPSKTLVEQGIQHGCMVYCRVAEQDTEIPGDPKVDAKNPNPPSITREEPSSGNAKRDEIVQLASKKESRAKKNDEVIDLIDSSDEEDTNKNDNDDDDDVEVISPRKTKSIRRKTSEDSPAPTPRKRQRSATDGHCLSSEPSNAGETIKNGNASYPNFQMASYNVWFGPPDPLAKQVFPKERMAGIVESLREACETKERNQGEACPLLFVGLQELTPNLVQYLQPQFQSIGYRLYTQPLGGFGPSYGVGIAISEDVRVLEQRFVPYRNSLQGRGFLLVRTPTLLFATTHLESWCGPQMTGSTEREFQIIEAARFCREQLRSIKGLELAIIAGDLNWDDERKRKPDEAPNRKLLSILKGGWKDAGTPFDYTYDAKENPMLNGHLRRRFDRCLFLSNPYGNSEQQPGQNYQSMGLEKIGKESIPNLVWNKRNQYNDSIKKMAVSPSDHFGIVIHFSKTH